MNIFLRLFGIFQKFSKFQRIAIASALIFIILAVPSLLFVASQNQNNTLPSVISSSKMWEIALEYNTQQGSLIIKNTKLIEGRATSSNVGLSPYRIQIIDEKDEKIYESDIHIAEEIIYNIYLPPSATQSGFTLPPVPEKLESIIYVPYFPDAKKAEVLKNSEKILEFTFPKQLSFDLIEKALAQSNSCTSNVKIVFISDGFANEGAYNQIVERVSGKFKSLSPYSEKPGMLEIQSIFNTTSLGCTNGAYMNMGCFSNQATWAQVREIIFARFPDYAGLDSDHFKMVILTDTVGHPQGGGQILGAFNGKGGQLGIFSTKLQLDNVAAHEVLGHGVGYLWDRYIYSPPHNNSQVTSTANSQSNCSDNPNGQGFWSDITGGGGHPGCTSNYLYAPYPRDCGLSGNSNSLMSSANCGRGQFDPVEKVFLRNQILPKYQSCSGEATQAPTTSPPATLTISPTPTIEVTSYAIFGYAFEDRNTNGERDAGDLGRSGITVSISGSIIKSTTTGSGGGYIFDDLTAGSYNLVFNDGSQVVPLNRPIVLTEAIPRQGEYNLILSTIRIPAVITSSPTVTPRATITQVPPGSTSTTAPTQQPSSGGGGSGGGGSPGGGSGGGSTPPTTYSCKLDPICVSGKKNLQLCPLICTPN